MAMISDAPITDPGLRQRIPLYPSQFMAAVIMASFGPLLDSMMTDLGIPLSRAGLVSGGFFLGSVLGIVLTNMCLARLSAKRALIVGNILQGILLAIAGFISWDLWSLAVIFFVAGTSGVMVNTTCWMWISAHMRKNAAASALQMILFFAMGMLLAPLILGLVLDRGGSWRWILVTVGALSFAVGLMCMLMPLPDVTGRRNVRFSDLRAVIAHDRGLLIGIVSACFFYAGAETTLNVWLPKFQIDVFGAGDTWASLSVTLFWMGLVAGRLIVMPLTSRYSPARLLLICACILAVFCVVMATAPTQAAALVLSVGAGLGASASYGLIGSYAGRFPEWQSAVASSAFILAGGLGSVVFPYLMGPIADAAGFRVALSTVAIPALAYGLLALLIHARTRW